MKKKLLLLGLFVCLLLTGCGGGGTKNAKTLDDFSKAGTDNGFTVVDNKSAYENISYITGAMKASSSDTDIEMVIYSDADTANKVLEEQIKNFNLLKSTGASEKKTTGDNYQKYFLISNNYYMVTSRVDNTLIFSKTLLVNKEEVDKVLDELGY